MRNLREILSNANISLKGYSIGEHRGACPKCAIEKQRSHDDALAVLIHDSGATWLCHRCGWKSGAKHYAACEIRDSKQSDEKTSGKFGLELWSRAKRINGTIGERYLRSRAIYCALPEHCLRFDAACWHSDSKRKYPAIISLFTDIRTDEPCGVHRTYLKADGSGKISDDKAKKMLGRSKGAAIKLTPNDEITLGLGICEGIETGLSLLSIGWRAVWALGSAGAIESFPVLGGVESLTVFADNDISEVGVQKARTCATRWQMARRQADVIYPGTIGDDWNDVVKGVAA